MIVRVLGIALMFTGIVLFVSRLPFPDIPSNTEVFYIIISGLATVLGAALNVIEG